MWMYVFILVTSCRNGYYDACVQAAARQPFLLPILQSWKTPWLPRGHVGVWSHLSQEAVRPFPHSPSDGGLLHTRSLHTPALSF